MKPLLFPPSLKKGDTIGIIAPAGQMRKNGARFSKGVDILHEMGFEVKFPKELWPGHDYLADSDENRGREFNRMFCDDKINGLISLRGGYGCLRMLDKIDIAAVISNPKVLVGFSDITILQNYLYQRTGMVSLHGPVVTSLGDATPDALASFFSCLTNTRRPDISSTQIVVLRDGPEAAAPLIGGNLASLVTLLGTRYDFSWDSKVVFLEDINEPVYKIDRMLTQLKCAGKLDSIAGLILGDFSTSTNSDKRTKNRYRESVWNRVMELCAEQSMPIWANFPSGHCTSSLTFPLGAVTVMKSGKKQLVFKQTEDSARI
ncbi:MAG: LD-carboxypeptidase [Desulforhopalus sp.]